MRFHSNVALALVALALAASISAQTLPPPKVVPPVIAPIPPAVPGVITTTPRSTTPNTRGPITAIVGQVVDTAGRPVPRAAVRLIADAVVETVLTDAKGRFAFTRIPLGEMVVVAQKLGYFDGAYGQKRATGLPLPFSLPTGQAMSNMRIEVFKSAVITGLVQDEAGEPIVGAHVFASRRQFVQGEWQFVGVGTEETNDEGEYRMFGLQPGEYVVTVGSMPVAANKPVEARAEDRARPSMFPRMFYPQTPDRVVALPVTLAPGDVRYAVNFTLAPVTTHRVSGRLMGPDAAIGSQTVRLVPVDASWATDEAASTTTLPDGTYTFEEMPEGRYHLQAGNVAPKIWSASSGSLADAINAARPYCGTADITVGKDDLTVPDIEMVQAAAIAGQVELVRVDGGGPAPERPRSVEISIEPAAPGLSRSKQVRTAAGVQWAVSDLIPGPYFVRVGSIANGWVLKSIEVGGNDAIDLPVDLKDADAIVNVTLADRGTEVIGTVRDNATRAAAGAAVIVLPGGVTRGNWSPNRVRETRTSTGGVFTVRGLPPGEYMVIVVDEAAAEGWQDDRVLARLTPLATRFTLREGELLSLNLQKR